MRVSCNIAMDDAPADCATQTSLPRRMARLLRRLGPAGPLAVFSAAMPAVGLLGVLKIVSSVKPWLASHGVLAIPVFSTGFVGLGGLALMPTYASSALAGWTFGFWGGLAAALMGLAGASLVGYAWAGRASGDRVVKLIEERPKWKAVYDALLCGNFWKTLLIVTLIRIPPTSAFAVTNLLMASTRVRRLPYLIGTVIGMTPRTAVVVFAASRMCDCRSFTEILDRLGKRDHTWMLLVSVVGTVVALFVMGYLANRALAHVTRPSAA